MQIGQVSEEWNLTSWSNWDFHFDFNILSVCKGIFFIVAFICGILGLKESSELPSPDGHYCSDEFYRDKPRYNHFFGRMNSYLVNTCVNNNIIWLSLSIIHSVVKWPRPIQTLCAKAFASFALVWIVVSVWFQSDLYRNNFCDVYTVCRREFILLWQLTEAWLHIVVILSFPLWLVKWAVMKT